MLNSATHFTSGDRPANSLVTQLDPRAKLAIVVAVLVGGAISGGLVYSGVVSVLLVLAIVSAGVSATRLFRALQAILILALITVLFHVLFTPGQGESLVTVWGKDISIESLLSGLYYALRLVLFVLAALFLTMTTAPIDLAEGIVKLCRPLRIFRVPVDDIGLILSMALRFIPILSDELVAVRRAQALRGVAFAGGFMARIRSTVPLLVPVFVFALNRADSLAVAIEARGYVHNQKRSYFSRLQFGVRECVIVIFAWSVLSLIFMWSRS